MNTYNRVLMMRGSRKRVLNLERLDDRIVPAPVSSGVTAVAAAVQTDAARGVLRHELRVERLLEKRELQVARLEAREARLEARYAARHHHRTAAAVTAVSVSSSFQQVSGAPIGSAETTSQPVSNSPTTVTPVAPVSVSSSTSTSTPVTSTNPATPITSPAPLPPNSVSSPTSTSSPVTSTNPATPVTSAGPLPSNVASALDTIYNEYESGTLPTTNGPGQIEIQGSDVGVMIKVTSPSDFATVSAQAQSLGLQVTGDSPATDTIAGWLPISQLPAVAQLADAPILAPIYGPIAR